MITLNVILLGVLIGLAFTGLAGWAILIGLFSVASIQKHKNELRYHKQKLESLNEALINAFLRDSTRRTD